MLVARSATEIVGCVGWELHGEHALLRSLVVRLGHRRRGIGRRLTLAVLERASAAGATEVFLLATEAAE